MQENQNIQIPLSTFMRLVSLVSGLSLGNYRIPSFYDVDGIYAELMEKLNKINLRTAYTNTILAKDDTQRVQAYANYQKLKNRR